MPSDCHCVFKHRDQHWEQPLRLAHYWGLWWAIPGTLLLHILIMVHVHTPIVHPMNWNSLFFLLCLRFWQAHWQAATEVTEFRAQLANKHWELGTPELTNGTAQDRCTKALILLSRRVIVLLESEIKGKEAGHLLLEGQVFVQKSFGFILRLFFCFCFGGCELALFVILFQDYSQTNINLF